MSDLLLKRFLKQISTPFEEWEAYRLGIIDKKGNTIKPRGSLITQRERNAFTSTDVLIRNIKKVLEKIPQGKSKFASRAAASYLVQEHTNFLPSINYSDEDMVYEDFMDFYELYVESGNKMFLTEEQEVTEDAPANSVAGGGIAGLREPIVRTTPRIKRRKKRNSFKQYVAKK